LAIAGGALDPNAPGGADLELAALLLAHALAAAAGAIEDRGADGEAGDFVATLDRSGVLARAAGTLDRGRAILACLTAPAIRRPSRDELVAAELLLGRIVRVLRGEPAIARSVRLRRWGFALLVACALTATLTPLLRGKPPWEKYRWTASSAGFGFPTTGTLGVRGPLDLLFHTTYEDRPSLTVDLLALRSIHSIAITNRGDCCSARCLPLVVEVAGDDGRYVELARRQDVFDTWDVRFPARRARYVRLRVEAATFFHLREIVIL
jgi:hypothetical protein